MTDTVKPDCKNCPAFVKKIDGAGVVGKSINGDICGLFGKPLERPDGATAAQSRAIRESAAKNCSEFGKPFDGTIKRALTATVALPMPQFREVVDAESSEEKRDAQLACVSCNMCRAFAKDTLVEEALGWTAGLCAAKGELVPANRRVHNAKNCEFRSVGRGLDSLEGLHTLPEYADGFGVADIFKAFSDGKARASAPAEHKTDKDVTEEEKAQGIKAWRKIVDPDSGTRSTLLPIYDVSFFSEEDQALIPKTGDPEHPEMYVDHFGGVYTVAICWAELDETPAVNGEAGTGKTELFRHLAWLMQTPFRRISITGSTELDDLAGKMHYSPDKGTYFQYGRLPTAWSSPGVICIDEPNTGPPDVWQFLRPLTDNSKQLILDVNKGEPVNRHIDCYMGMAMNPAWDIKNVGTSQIGDADTNRLFHISLGLPPAELERKIIKERVKLDGWEISGPQLDMVMRIAREVRALVDNGTLSISWALRPQIKVARALRWFEPVVAYRRAVADYLEPESQQALLDVVRSHAR